MAAAQILNHLQILHCFQIQNWKVLMCSDDEKLRFVHKSKNRRYSHQNFQKYLTSCTDLHTNSMQHCPLHHLAKEDHLHGKYSQLRLLVSVSSSCSLELLPDTSSFDLQPSLLSPLRPSLSVSDTTTPINSVNVSSANSSSSFN